MRQQKNVLATINTSVQVIDHVAKSRSAIDYICNRCLCMQNSTEAPREIELRFRLVRSSCRFVLIVPVRRRKTKALTRKENAPGLIACISSSPAHLCTTEALTQTINDANRDLPLLFGRTVTCDLISSADAHNEDFDVNNYK